MGNQIQSLGPCTYNKPIKRSEEALISRREYLLMIAGE